MHHRDQQHGVLYAQAWNPHNTPLADAVTASIAITLWAFLGLESACANSDAVENPERNVPIAVLGGTLGVAVVYIASISVIAGIVPNAELAASSAPFGLAFSKLFGPMVGQVVIALMIVACVGSLLGWQFTVAQVFKSSADVGYFIKAFGKVNGSGAPVVGMLILIVVQTALALMTISPTLSKQFDVLVNLAVVTNLVPYVLSMSALAVLLESRKVGQPDLNWGIAAALVGNLYSLYAMYGSGKDAMMWGSIVTFIGWVLYGSISRRYGEARHQASS